MTAVSFGTAALHELVGDVTPARMLDEAWRAGVVLCGGSAGSLCWFTEAISGFHEGPPRRVDGLGLLPWTNAVHYVEEAGRQSAFLEAIAAGMGSGYGVGDAAALHFIGTELHEVVASQPGARARYVCADRNGRAVEHDLPVRYLGDPMVAMAPAQDQIAV